MQVNRLGHNDESPILFRRHDNVFGEELLHSILT